MGPLLVLVLLVVVGLAGCGGGDESASTTTQAATTTEATTTEESANVGLDPKLLVAQLSDLPTGYRIDQESTGPMSLEEWLADSTPEETALGKAEWVAGHRVQFAILDTQDPQQSRLMSCLAVVYRTSEGAAKHHRLTIDQADPALVERANIEEELGDEAAAFNVEYEGVSAFDIEWRDDNVLAGCTNLGVGYVDPAETMRVAQAQQERIAAALD